MAEPLLQLAEELERRDLRAAAELAEIARLGAELERTRGEAAETASFLAGLPGAHAGLDDEDAAAAAARGQAQAAADDAEASLRRAEERGGEEERLTAARAVQNARAALAEAEARVQRARAERARLEAEAEERRRVAAALEDGARSLADALGEHPRIAREAADAPEPGLDGVLAWASTARGALLLAGSGLATERDRVAREATELVASVSGDPRTLAGVRGLRERVERELRRS